MYKNILVPMALDHGISPNTIELAKALLQEGGTITALHVYDVPNSMVSNYMSPDDIKKANEGLKQSLADKLKDFPEIKGVLQSGHAARTIIDYAAEQKVDCIIMGSHKPGLGDYFIGSTASRVVRHANCAVHVYR